MADSNANALVVDGLAAQRLLKTLKTYYRLTKPGIIYGNLMTAGAGFLLASRWHVDGRLLLALLVGTALIIASACVLNNYIDRRIDKKMSRTSRRALVTGEVSVLSALVYATCLGVVGFAILAQTNRVTFGIGLAALFSYVVLYGLAKRRTKYGTLVGTLPGAASLVAGYSAVTDRLDLGALVLFLIMLCWQMPHFYAIAIYRLGDYKAAGLPVWPVKQGLRSTKVQILLFVGAFVIACSLLTIFGYAGYTYLVVMIVLGFTWLRRGLQGFNRTDTTKWARGMFGFSLVVLLSLSAMLSVGSVLP